MDERMFEIDGWGGYYNPVRRTIYDDLIYEPDEEDFPPEDSRPEFAMACENNNKYYYRLEREILGSADIRKKIELIEELRIAVASEIERNKVEDTEEAESRNSYLIFKYGHILDGFDSYNSIFNDETGYDEDSFDNTPIKKEKKVKRKIFILD
jgi:hypothetical protein